MKATTLTCLFFAYCAPALAAQAETEKFGELTLYITPASPVKMEWESPDSLLFSVIKAALFNGDLTIGHVSVEVSCGLTEGSAHPQQSDPSSYLLTSAIPSSGDPSRDLLLNEGFGFSILESSWQGAVETPEQVKSTFQVVNGKPNELSVVTFLIPETSCRRLTQYFREYSATPNLYYGFSPRPRRKEGAGCSAFGISFLELAGIMTEEWRKKWTVTVNVPLALMAGYNGMEQISVWDILWSRVSGEWARKHDPHMKLEAYEPGLMHSWIRKLAASPKALSSIGGSLNRNLNHGLKGVSAIRIDRRFVPTPTEPIFIGEPALRQNSKLTVVRTDKVVSPNGSFEISPTN